MSEPHTADLGTRYRYRQEGAELERERIFELLKELWETTYAKGSSYPGSNAVLDAIALIKGENK